jgi:hypothetical protein
MADVFPSARSTSCWNQSDRRRGLPQRDGGESGCHRARQPLLRLHYLILAPTHQSLLDPWLIMSALPSRLWRMFTALTLARPRATSELERRFVEPLAERLFGGYPELAYVDALRRGVLPDNIRVTEFYFQPGSFLESPLAQQQYVSSNYTHVVRDIVDAGVNVLAQLVARTDEDGDTLLSLSCNSDLTLDLAPRMREAERAGDHIALLAEVNRNLPFMYGDAAVRPDYFDALVDEPKYDFPLFGPPNSRTMPEAETLRRARRDKEQGQAPSTQAGEFVREEIHHVREGKHGARSTKQAIAIGLSKARRAGVELPPPPASAKAKTKQSAKSASRAAKRHRPPSTRRSRAIEKALQREPHAAASPAALARHAREAARKRGPAARKAAARKAVRTKGPQVRRAAARKAAKTRQRRRRAQAS